MSSPSLPPDWSAALQSHGLSQSAIDQIVATAYSEATHTHPARPAVFRAFELTPVERVRVVIVGQDPYPNATNATGVAFSTGADGQVSDALRAIYRNLASDRSFKSPTHGDLTEWADRGALMLNTALTLNASSSLAVRCAMWRPFLQATLAAVSATGRPIPVILLGSRALKLRTAIAEPESVISAGHPTPRNKIAIRFRMFEDARPFSEADDFLVTRGEPAFDWSLR